MLFRSINPDSLKVLSHCYLEPSLGNARVGDSFQFEREGYFCLDMSTNPNKQVFNRTVTLRDTWTATASPKPGQLSTKGLQPSVAVQGGKAKT